MQEAIAKLQSELEDLLRLHKELAAEAHVIEERGNCGSANLLAEMIGKTLAFRLQDGRVIKGTLLQNQLRCLRVRTADGELILNTLFVDALQVE